MAASLAARDRSRTASFPLEPTRRSRGTSETSGILRIAGTRADLKPAASCSLKTRAFKIHLRLSAGSLSLAVSLPTMLVGFTRYSRDQSFGVLRQNWGFLLVMAAGSIVGTFIGGRLLGLVPSYILLPLLAAVLLISAVKVWRHNSRRNL